MEKMQFDHSKLRGRIREKLGTEQEFQKRMGFSKFTTTNRLNGASFFKTDEIKLACVILDIPASEIPAYFFSHNSSENLTI